MLSTGFDPSIIAYGSTGNRLAIAYRREGVGGGLRVATGVHSALSSWSNHSVEPDGTLVGLDTGIAAVGEGDDAVPVVAYQVNDVTLANLFYREALVPVPASAADWGSAVHVAANSPGWYGAGLELTLKVEFGRPVISYVRANDNTYTDWDLWMARSCVPHPTSPADWDRVELDNIAGVVGKENDIGSFISPIDGPYRGPFYIISYYSKATSSSTSEFRTKRSFSAW